MCECNPWIPILKIQKHTIDNFKSINCTTTLHLLGVVIGHVSIKNNISLILLRLTGVSFAVYGIYLLNQIF